MILYSLPLLVLITATFALSLPSESLIQTLRSQNLTTLPDSTDLTSTPLKQWPPTPLTYPLDDPFDPSITIEFLTCRKPPVATRAEQAALLAIYWKIRRTRPFPRFLSNYRDEGRGVRFAWQSEGPGSKRPGWEVVKLLEVLAQLVSEYGAAEVDAKVVEKAREVKVAGFEISFLGRSALR